MECYKEYPRSIGMLTALASIVYLMAAEALLLELNPWMAGGFALLYMLVHYVHYPRSACVHCYYYGRYCISFKGRLARWLFRRGSEVRFRAGMRRAMHGVYLLWIYPFVMLIIMQIRGRSLQVQDLLLAAVLITLMVMRQLMRRNLGCRTCMMSDKCPNVSADPRRPVEVINGAPVSPKP